jgi:hypothetical protein
LLWIELNKSESVSIILLLPDNTFVEEVDLILGDLAGSLCGEREIKSSLWLSDCGKIYSVGSLCNVLVLNRDVVADCASRADQISCYGDNL